MTINLALILTLIVTGSGLLFFAASFLRKGGKTDQQLSDLKHVSELQHKQEEAVNQAPRTKDDLLDKLSKGEI